MFRGPTGWPGKLWRRGKRHRQRNGRSSMLSTGRRRKSRALQNLEAETMKRFRKTWSRADFKINSTALAQTSPQNTVRISHFRRFCISQCSSITFFQRRDSPFAPGKGSRRQNSRHQALRHYFDHHLWFKGSIIGNSRIQSQNRLHY